MRLFEHEAKQLLRKWGIATPRGGLAQDPSAARSIAERMGRSVVKAQVLIGGRGKAGGIKFAATPDEAAAAANELLGSTLRGDVVSCVLVEERVSAVQELYASVALDWVQGRELLLLSSAGGVEIEASSAGHPHSVLRRSLEPLDEFPAHAARELAREAGLRGPALVSVADTLLRLVRGAAALDLVLAEINPLFLLPDGRVIAGDAKVEIDDSAVPRQQLALKEIEAAAGRRLVREGAAGGAQIAYVPLDGDIGIIAGGAGLALATMDTVHVYGGRPADFLDIGGGGSSELMADALRTLLAQPSLHGIVVNVYGGINNCEVMSSGIVQVWATDRPSVPIVVKMRGHFQEQGWAMLEAERIPIVKQGTTDDAVKLLLQLVQAKTQAAETRIRLPSEL